jgi:DNA replication protein DnaC
MPVTKLTTKLTPDELLTHLHDALAVLGLGELRRALDETIAEPNKDESRLAWLWRLVEPQLRRRLESRAERRIREARLPVRKTFEAFNFGFQPKLDKDLVMELATLRFVAQGKNLLIAGMSGTGKSHIALALALLACAANRRVLYTTSADMLARLNMSLADDTLAQALKPYTRAELLVLDEVGLEQVERNEARRSGLMQKVLLPRYNQQLATIITTNQTRYAPNSRKFDGDPGPSYWGASTVGACALDQRTRWPRGGSCCFIKAATVGPWFTQRRRPARNGRRCRRSCSRS